MLSLGIIPESQILESGARLSVSLEGPDIFSAAATGKSPLAASSSNSSSLDMNLDELRAVNRYAESTKSLSFLPQVSEKIYMFKKYTFFRLYFCLCLGFTMKRRRHGICSLYFEYFKTFLVECHLKKSTNHRAKEFGVLLILYACRSFMVLGYFY